jgi:hypothetical protein
VLIAEHRPIGLSWGDCFLGWQKHDEMQWTVREQAHELSQQRPCNHVLDNNGVSRSRVTLGDFRGEQITELRLGKGFLAWLWGHLMSARNDESAKHVTLYVNTCRERRSQRLCDRRLSRSHRPRHENNGAVEA